MLTPNKEERGELLCIYHFWHGPSSPPWLAFTYWLTDLMPQKCVRAKPIQYLRSLLHDCFEDIQICLFLCLSCQTPWFRFWSRFSESESESESWSLTNGIMSVILWRAFLSLLFYIVYLKFMGQVLRCRAQSLNQSEVAWILIIQTVLYSFTLPAL